MLRLASLTALLAAVGVWPAATLQARPAAPSAAVFDRTFLCSTMPIGGGMHAFDVRAQAGIRQSRTTWKSLGSAVVSTGRTASRTAVLDNAFAWTAAGTASRETNLGLGDVGFLYPVQAYGAVAMSQRLCRPATARVRLTAKGLRGGAIGQLGAELDCPSPRRVLVRVRANLRGSAPLYTEHGLLKSKATVRDAYLAVRTQSGRRLAFAAVYSTGKVRLFTARTCSAD